jgi:hypothetical protein
MKSVLPVCCAVLLLASCTADTMKGYVGQQQFSF